MTDTITLDRLYLEWSRFTKAMNTRDLALDRIARSVATRFEDPAEHANWCVAEARLALGMESEPM